jgi:hypothetical protein
MAEYRHDGRANFHITPVHYQNLLLRLAKKAKLRLACHYYHNGINGTDEDFESTYSVGKEVYL